MKDFNFFCPDFGLPTDAKFHLSKFSKIGKVI